MTRRLNFGCGSIQPSGWMNVDSNPYYETPFKDLNSFSDDTFDIIVAHASIQQIEWHNLVTVLQDLHRILVSGGVLRISLPDIERGFEAYQQNHIDWFPNGETNIHDRFSAWLTWYSTTKTLLTHGALANKLHEAGFRSVFESSYKQSDVPGAAELDTREGEFFFMEAYK